MRPTSSGGPVQPLFRHGRQLLLAAALCGTLSAQIPLGSALMSSVTNSAPMEGLLLVDPGGTATPITGLLVNSFPNRNVPAVLIDPWDGRIWIGGPAFTTTRLHRAEILGSTLANATQMSVINPGSGTQAIALDLNGNAVVATDNSMTYLVPNAGGGLFRVHRHTGAVSRLIGGTTNWPFNHFGAISAVCTDDSGNLWFAVTNDGTTPGRIYRLAPGPHGDYAAPPTLLAAVPGTSAGNVSSLEWAPARGSRMERLWFITGGPPGLFVGYFENGVASFVPGVGSHAAIEHDATADDFWLVSPGTDPDEVRRMDHAGNVTTVAQVPPGGINGGPTSIDVHDAELARTLMVPQFLPVSGPFDLEICTTCPPGHLGGVVMVAPANGTFVLGIAGVDGRIHTRLNGLTFARGLPGVITFQSACFDPTTGALRIGDPVLWPRN